MYKVGQQITVADEAVVFQIYKQVRRDYTTAVLVCLTGSRDPITVQNPPDVDSLRVGDVIAVRGEGIIVASAAPVLDTGTQGDPGTVTTGEVSHDIMFTKGLIGRAEITERHLQLLEVAENE